MTVAPLVADGVILTGISGAEYGTRGFIDGWDPATGKHLWRTHTIPSPDEPGGDTWTGDTCETGGGSTWVTGSYDPQLNFGLLGHRQSRPVQRPVRPGDNLYTCVVLALDAQYREDSNGITSTLHTIRLTGIRSRTWGCDASSDGEPPKVADGCQSQRLHLCARPHQRKAAGG